MISIKKTLKAIASNFQDSGWNAVNKYLLYRKIGNTVYLRIDSYGELFINSAGVNIGILPEGFRPLSRKSVIITPKGGSVLFTIYIEPNGNVNGFSSATSNYFEGDISFIIN